MIEWIEDNFIKLGIREMSRRNRRNFEEESGRKIGGFDIINGILSVVLLISGVLVGYTMLKYNFLNFRGVNYILLAVIIFVFIISIVLLIKRKAKFFTTIALLILNVILIFTFLQFRTAINLFNNLNNTAGVNEYTMSVVVLKNNKANNLKDIAGEQIAAPVSADGENINKLMKNIRDNEKLSLNLVEVKNYVTGYEQLKSGETQAMILNSSYESFITAQYPEFLENTKKIYEFKITKAVTAKNNAKAGDTFNVYISGIDTYGPISSVSRSDVNIIMTVNKNTGKILLTTTPRDSYVKIADGGNNQYDKLTHAGVYGVDASIHTLENLYGIKIDYYARLNFTSFLKLIDTLGGIDVYNDQSFKSHIGGYDFSPGVVHLDSQHALAFVRERYGLTGGDNDRGKNQEKVITAIIKKLSSKEGLANYNSIIKELNESIQTNMPLETAMSLANEQLSAGKDYTVSSQALTGHGTMGLPSYAMPGANLYMTQIDNNSLKEVSENIKNVLDGK
ncbi:cell envelope-like function transcriptional attenuator common domain protein [Gemella bergeri ATCC 700627]|uniref:Cell envelope-like function transcriptional attenuator common domain protein n=1 Tax=Gemella bergeri ATCC 700627 TaxID=1321820 RepID=U2S098_9BACL|nr:LCP family protein [Gemella bergeri]ERK56262.1 cell envelope-like function transcriptional attenuator common domain protein [Gemella bergeri ATCC 700627]